LQHGIARNRGQRLARKPHRAIAGWDDESGFGHGWGLSFWIFAAPIKQKIYSCFNLKIYSQRKCYEIEKRSGVYMDVHEHRIAEVKAFAALEIFKVE
jgi:hypothetical protein